MTTQDQINADLKSAMIAKNQQVVDVLRQVKTTLSNVALNSGNISNAVADDTVLTSIRKLIAQRKDSVEQFTKGNRADLADKELSEIEILEKYLPVALTSDELSEIVQRAVSDVGATSKKDMGKVIKRAGELAQGRTDNKSISTLVAKLLS
jgi:uncharacterized protein YqeY